MIGMMVMGMMVCAAQLFQFSYGEDFHYAHFRLDKSAH